MNAAKDRKTDDIRAYLDRSQRDALTSQARFTEILNVPVTPTMRSDIEYFSEKHGVSKAQAVRMMVHRSMANLDKELTRKARDLSH